MVFWRVIIRNGRVTLTRLAILLTPLQRIDHFFNRWGSSVALYGVTAGIIRSVSFHQTTQSFSLKLCVSNGQKSMGEIRVKKDNLTSEFDKAFQLFFEGFLRSYPKETWPSWFRTSTNYGGCKKSEGVWEFCFTGIPSSVLGAGDSWEERNGGYILVKTDPDTGAKRYVISNASNEVFVIFKAVVDINSENFSVVFSTDIYEIDGRDLLPLRK